MSREKREAGLTEQYTAALDEYLRGGGEESFQRSYELGRRALDGGTGVLKMVQMHHEAFASVLRSYGNAENNARLFESGWKFLMESLTPFEMAHRGFQEANQVLRQWNERLEREAKRIAQALHDDVGQLLACVHVSLQTCRSKMEPSQQGQLKQVQDFLYQIEDEIRRLSHELRPTIHDDLGLLPALRFLANGFAKRGGLSITVEGSAVERLPNPIETALYRITQEALQNVQKHAQAQAVHVTLRRRSDALDCSIRDDGVGFNVDEVLKKDGQRGLGLIGMQERLSALGGTLEIHSGRGQGTSLVVTIPVDG